MLCVQVCVCGQRPPFKQCTVNTAFIFCDPTSLHRFSQCFAMDIMRHKDAVDDIAKTGKCIMNSKSPEEKEMLKVEDFFFRVNINIHYK